MGHGDDRLSLEQDDEPSVEELEGYALDRELRVAQVKLVTGVFLLVLLLFGMSFYGSLTRGERLAFDVDSVSYPTDIVVVTGFRPTPFHTEELSEHGYYGGRDGDPSRIIITRATREDVDKIASIPWVETVEALQ